MSVRKALLKVHLWMGLGAALLILLLAGTGTLLVFENEIDRLLNPKLLTVAPQDGNLPIAELVARLRTAFPGNVPVTLGIQSRPDVAWQAMMGGRKVALAYVNPHTGEVLGSRPRDKHFTYYVHQLHMRLLYGKTGEAIVGYGTVCLLFLLFSGLVLWWRRKLLAIQTAGSWRRINFDLHHVSGIYTALFILIVAVSGVLMSFSDTLMPLVYKIARAEPSDDAPERPFSTPQKGVKPIGPDRAFEIARGLLPGAQPTFFGLALGPKATYDIGFKFPEDCTPGGRSRVSLDQFTGETLLLRNSRQADRATKISNLIRPIHTGDIYGWPSRIVMALASFSVVVQAITGILIWWPRVFKRAGGVVPTNRELEQRVLTPDSVPQSAARRDVLIEGHEASDYRTV